MVVFGSRTLGKDDLERVIEHVFLPRKLPSSAPAEETLILDEANILGLWASVIRKSNYTDLIPEATQKLFDVWADIQSAHVPTEERISDALKNLGKNEMFGYYVRGQNAAFMVSINGLDVGTISTFKASMNSNTVMTSQDMAVCYPEQSITISKSELLGSRALARQIVTLTNQTMLDTLEVKNTKAGAEIREVPDTVYISEWLTSVLSNSNSKMDSDFPTICKKVRDNVEWNNALLPFRRSGLFMSLKVILHLSLLRSKRYTVNDCLVVYKIIMAEALRKICEAGENTSLDPDLGLFMMKKLARRVMKLKALTVDTLELKRGIETLHRDVSTTIKIWKSKMMGEWEHSIEKQSMILEPLAVNIKDVDHKQIPKIPELDVLNQGYEVPKEAPKCLPRHPINVSEMPCIGLLSSGIEPGSEGLGNILFDIEAWIFQHLDTRKVDHAKLFEFSVEYVKAAVPYYKKTCNPVGASRMILAFLKIVRTFDQIAVQKFPLLLEHRVGVDCRILEQLLLPLRSELELGNELEVYFSERDKVAKYPSLIEQDVISTNSFSVRYAEGNQEMCDLRDKILADAEGTIKDKLGQVREGKRKCEDLRQRMQGKTCSGNLKHNGSHANACARCDIEEQLKEYRIKVYERPLREEPEDQLAVVFELLIPSEISCLRDVLSLVFSDICSAKAKSFKIDGRIWTSYFQVQKYRTGSQQFFKLGSTNKSFVNSHYSEKHPDSPEEDFIVPNNYNCTFDGNYEKTCKVNKYCRFRIQKDSIYSVLEWTLKSTFHTQNQVLARQSECPHEIRISEYKEFGSLRAGHRLQLRNILRSLIDKSLSLKDEAVFTLICQALWEAGPQVNGEFNWYRDSHADLVNQDFAEALMEELKTLLNTYEHNWAEPYTLMTTIVLTCRVLEFGLVTEEASELILRCRRTAFDWIQRIESKIAESYESDSALDHKQILKLKLVDACICLCWTYSVGEQYLEDVLRSEEDLFYWLHAMTRIYNNITCSTITNLSPMKAILLRKIQTIALQIKPRIRNFARRGFELFVKENWNEASKGEFDNWTSFPSPAEQIYYTKFKQNNGEDSHIQVDILRGSFLINGFPVGYLSEAITKHPTFSRTFKNIVFEVLPAGANTFITTHEFNNAFYSFSINADRTTLIVRERRSIGEKEELQLIPHGLFKGLIPRLLVENYSHWLNKTTNYIEFRPISFEDFRDSKTKFSFDIFRRRLLEISSGRELFCIKSSTHQRIASFLSRLENRKYIHSFLDSRGSDPEIIVELPRMNLHFKFNKELCTLESLEYNMLVRANQNINTLIGLENGLVLENKFKDLKVLIPHGKVNVKSHYNWLNHQKLEINLNELKKPAIFTFDVDRRLRNLKAGKTCTGWLYLAYLHAKTSGPLADPFTGLTGTESAFSILQSGHCWSCKPYEPESMVVLEAILKLSPVRKYYPPHFYCMEQVTWPEGLPVHGAHDGFRLIVDKLVADSIRMKSLFPSSDDDKKEEKASDENGLFLNRRAYLRYEGFCSEELRISRQFCGIPAPESKHAESGREWRTVKSRIDNTRSLSELGQSWKFSRPQKISIESFLVGQHDSLSGLNDWKSLLSKMSIVELQKLDFRNNWIDLYELARNVKKDLRSEWIILLTTLAFIGVDFNQLLLLHAVAVKRVFFQAQDPPPGMTHYTTPSESSFNGSKIISTFTFDRQSSEAINQARELVALLETLWPIDACKLETFEDLPRHCVNLQIESLNSVLRNWNTNRRLVEFLRKVEATTNKLLSPISVRCSEIETTNFEIAIFQTIKSFKAARPKLADFRDMLKEPKLEESTAKLYTSSSNQLKSVSGSSPYTEYEGSRLLAHLNNENAFYGTQVQKILGKIVESFVYSETEFLYESDLVKLTPTSLLRRLLVDSNRNKCNQNIEVLIGALGVLWTQQQRVSRCLLYHSMGRAGSVQLSREQENPGHENWVPADHPEWLLFEIEMNLMIRPVQINVARQMITPPDLPEGKKHAVMQLNMGEGKTAVIVPLLALSLANREQLCRVTVLKSLFSTNFASLVYNLGGLLNRRIYQFPCRRDMHIDGQTASTMLQLYKECQQQQGVVLTLPEYRLSCQLKGYEKCRSVGEEFEHARSLIGVQSWLEENTRDILDESDEILHAKYQLIYTLGTQLPVDGGQLRWTVAQSLLKLIPARAAQLEALEKFGKEYVDATVQAHEPEIFHHTRLLRKECYQQLIESLATDILDGKSPGIKLPLLPENQKKLAFDLLTKADINKEAHDEALKLFESVQQQTILILMGYLKYDILYLTLSKRWRVNYGVDKHGERKMAIPFRAKDLPAKRTEFGHPDVAIMLTQLSYYYSGLSNEELEECFVQLNFIPNKEQEYASWINEIPVARNIDQSIRDFSSINLTDLKQKHEILFPALRRNTMVVDFWLSQTVFPHESRAFDKKLVCTAWDLCPASSEKPVTGFSGTNDSTVLLPLPVSQQDLPELQDTNENLRKTILLPENNNFKILPRGTSGIDILKSLVSNGIPILLDSGALMLELSNEKVAEEWLKLLEVAQCTRYNAAVYFDDDHNLRVKDRNRLDESSPYDLSPYREKMEQCIVYLDDAHTRGTDLKIPPPSKACVTLCAGMTRDKMVQACMRMRLLGKGHTISFYASDEAANAIKTNALANMGFQDTVEWIFQKFEEPMETKTTILEMKATDKVQLRTDVKPEEVLKAISATNINMLFDAGGVMSDLSSEEVAKIWLTNSKSKKWKGVVYINENHDLSVERLGEEGECLDSRMYLFYVDAAHTNQAGYFMISSALKSFRRVCVTISNELPKDSLQFILHNKELSVLLLTSSEVEKQVKSFIPENLGSRHVMDWVCENSKKFEQDGLVYWSGSGINYAHKQTMHEIFERSTGLDSDYANLGKRCCDKDFLKLDEMYGEHRQDLLYTEVLKGSVARKKAQMFRQVDDRVDGGLVTHNQDLAQHWPVVMQKIFDPVCSEILARCSSKIGSKHVFGQLLDEEHEKENEEEAEQERQISRPPPRVPADHVLSDHVKSFMETGALLPGEHIQKLHHALKKTSLFTNLEFVEWCGQNIFVTHDFVNVIKSSNAADKEDEFLRTPNWIASVREGGTTKLLILSPFEANYFFQTVRSNKSLASIRMFAPRIVPRQSVLINSPKLALSTPPMAGRQSLLPLSENLLAPLYMFSGTLYFENDAEQSAFCYFTGIVPRDWTEAEQKAFDAKKIDNKGFIRKQHRLETSQQHYAFCHFDEHPENLVRGIIEARHRMFPETSHVAQVVLDCRRVTNYEK